MRRHYKLGTFNVKNLASPGFEFYDKSYTADQYHKKVAWTGDIIRLMDADLIGFQEVWSDQALHDALDTAELGAGKAYTTVAFGGEDEEGPRVAVATRLPVIEAAETIRDFPRPVAFQEDDLALSMERFRRPVQRIVVALHTRPVTVFVAHLKSKRPTFPIPEGATFAPEEDLRTADLFLRTVGSLRSLVTRASEATALRALLIEETQARQQPVVLLGDLNDGLHSVTTDMVTGEVPFRDYAWLTKPGTDERYSAEENWAIKRRLWDVELYNAEQIQSRRSLHSPVYTHIYGGRYESLDHILVSEEFYYRNRDRIGDVEYLHCFNDHLVDESIGGDRIIDQASDHAPLVVTIAVESPT
jgi:predicted extracellular nuclease